MPTITEELLKALNKSDNIEEFFDLYENYFLNQSTADYLNEMLAIKKLKISSVARESGEGEYVYKIFKGDKNPSRNVLISIAFGMNLSLEETQLLLRLSKYSILDSRDKRDSIIIYGLINNLTIFQTDDMLEKQNMATLN